MKKYFIFMTVIVIIIGISFLYFETDNYNSENYIEKLIQKYNPQGASVIILDDFKIKEAKNFGYANVESKIPVDVNTQFKIASISKTVTTYGIMQLVDKGVLDLDEPISTYLTRWQLPDTEYDESKVTLRTLLSHTSGVSGSDEYGYSIPLPDVASALKERGIHLKREPATAFEYSEFSGYGICQLIIEEVTGKKFETYIQESVFSKSGMIKSSYLDTANEGCTLAAPYAGFSHPIRTTPIVMVGAGGVTTTGDDLARFVIELMRYYQTGSEMFEVQPNTNESWCLGITFKKLENGKIVYEHNGTLTGWNAQIAFEPDSGKGIVVMTNSDKAFYLTYDMMKYWGKYTLGEDIVDSNITGMENMINIAILILAALILFCISISFFRVRKGKLVIPEKRVKLRRLIISSIVIVIFIAIWIVTFYTPLIIERLYSIPDYNLFTFFPLSFNVLNIEIIIIAVLLVIRSGFKKNHNSKSIQP